MTLPDPKSPLESAVAKALAEQRKFEEKRATRLGAGAEKVMAPAGRLLRRIIPPMALRKALLAADRGAGLTVPAVLKSHDVNALEDCETAALRVQAWAAGSNAATGGVAGWFGGVGLTIDIPATITLAARNVRATGLAYGFDGQTEGEHAFRLALLELAVTTGFDARSDALGRMNALARELSEPDVRFVLDKAGEWLIDKVVDRVGRQVGASLLSRKAAQVVPVVGGAVAAGINASFQTDVSRAARYGYRQRWLMHRNLLPAPKENA